MGTIHFPILRRFFGVVLLTFGITSIAEARLTREESRSRSFIDRLEDLTEQDGSNDVLRTTRELATDFGTQRGYSLKGAVGLPHLGANGQFIAPKNRVSNCTTATYSAFLKTLSDLHRQGKLRLTSSQIKLLNSRRFWNVWNANGHGIMQIIDDLGGQVYRERSIQQLKAGDFVKIDRTNNTGHTVIFTRFRGPDICYWSSNKSTNGLGEKCEPRKRSKIVAARLPSARMLGLKLDALAESIATDKAYASVRARGSEGYVSLAGIKNLITAEGERSAASAPLGGMP